jgi:hypothetical protein
MGKERSRGGRNGAGDVLAGEEPYHAREEFLNAARKKRAR